MCELLDSSDRLDQPEALLARLRESGYVFLRGLLPAEDVWATRQDVLDTLVQVGWASKEDPAVPAVAPVPEERYREGGIPLQGLESLHRLGHNQRLRDVVGALLPGAFGHPARVLRVVWPHRRWPDDGEFVHQDWSVFHVPDMLTAWYPLGDAPRRLGPLRVLTGSHRDGTIGRLWLGEEESVDTNDPRWASADFRAGDVILFHCLTVHTGTRNTTDRFRLSMDVRWQSPAYPAPEVALWPHVDLHFRISPTSATQPGWDEVAGHWRDRAPVEPPGGLTTFDHTAPDLPRAHPRPSRFLI